MPLRVKWGPEGSFDSEDFDSDIFSIEVDLEKGLKIETSFAAEEGLKAKLAFDFKQGLKVKT